MSHIFMGPTWSLCKVAYSFNHVLHLKRTSSAKSRNKEHLDSESPRTSRSVSILSTAALQESRALSALITSLKSFSSISSMSMRFLILQLFAPSWLPRPEVRKAPRPLSRSLGFPRPLLRPRVAGVGAELLGSAVRVDGTAVAMASWKGSVSGGVVSEYFTDLECWKLRIIWRSLRDLLEGHFSKWCSNVEDILHLKSPLKWSIDRYTDQ